MRAIAAVCAAASLLALSAHTRADEPPPTLRSKDFSPYEERAIEDALASFHATVDDAPEGKTLDGIDIVTLDVLDPNDPVPKPAATAVNALHVTTKRYVIDREVLLRPGQPYKTVTVEESVRNLRSLPQLSLVVAVATTTKGSAPNHVRLLVITKDVWSLRLQWDVQLSSSGLEDLVLQPSETNFLGTHQVASLYFEMDPATYTFGAGYHVPRIQGTRNVLDTSANVVFNRSSGELEGSYGGLSAYQPIFSAKTEWAWDSLVTWDEQITRRFVGVQEAEFQATVGGPNDVAPWEYHTRQYLAQESITRSLGYAVKHDLSLGGYVSLNDYRSTAAQDGVSPAALAQFESYVLPRSDDRVGPFVQYHGYEMRFIRVLDFGTLGLQEDYRLGGEAWVRLYPVFKALGSSRDFFGTYGGFNYTIPFGDGLMRASVESLTEAEPDRLADAQVDGGFAIVTPRIGIGRLVYGAFASYRYRNYSNVLNLLGGDTNLRGYPSNYFVGKDQVNSNLEYRSRPIELGHAMELGAAAFYDVGDAFDGWSNLRPAQSVGLGLRTLFPQLDRLVFRADFGFPMGESSHLPGVAPFSFFIAFGQAFGLPTAADVALPSSAPSN
jgi:hypothetical protein